VNVTLLSHNLSSNAVMRAHRLASALAMRHEVSLLGPVEKGGPWPGLPREPWIHSVPKLRFPDFSTSFAGLVEAVQGDVLVAIKPQLASFGAALVAAEIRDVPVILDLDDLDTALAPRAGWDVDPSITDLARPGSAVYVSLLTRAAGAASAITVASTALRERFGGTVVPHGSDERLFDPGRIHQGEARAGFGFEAPTVVFPGTPRRHKGIDELVQAVAKLPGVRLAVTCRPTDLSGPEWTAFELERVPVLSYELVPRLLAAADVVALPQLDNEAGRYQMPMKAFDAMAMGRPIVATTVSDLGTVLNGCARLVPPGDVDALTQAISDLLEHPKEARVLGERARERFLECYSLRRVGDTLDAVVGRVVG
jgi:glycosyltransferase involved in cell wall biosynthesis